MKGKVITVAICTLFAIAICFLTAAGIHNEQAKGLTHSVTIQAKETGFDLSIIRQIMEDPESEDTFCAWKEDCDLQMFASESGRSTAADRITVYGPTRCILPWGKNLSQEDTKGCLIGIRTAEELFGGHHVEGQKLICEDRELTVRGVVDTPERILICEACPNITKEETSEETSFERINIRTPQEEDGYLTGTDFCSRYGLSAQLLRFDLYQNLSWIGELIPGKWSDFSGWTENIEKKQEERSLVESVKKSVIETLYFNEIRKRNLHMIFGILSIGTAFAIKRCRFLLLGFSLFPLRSFSLIRKTELWKQKNHLFYGWLKLL